MKKNILPPLCLLLLAFLTPAFQAPLPVERPTKVQTYITKYRYLAVELNQNTGIPIPIIIAVAGLESDWGSSDLALRGNNHFGIKAKDWQGPNHCKFTYEYLNEEWRLIEACFRKYTFIRDSYNDFGNFLRTRPHYQILFAYPQHDLQAWAKGLLMCQYATDPDYPEKLLRLIREYELDKV
jgi:flagellum-specific peptidoglycan hydrolase FlgJ